MTERNKKYLRLEFKNGERPSAGDFEDLFDSFLNKKDDLSLDDDGNMSFSGSLHLSDSDSTELGTLRFHDNKVQYYNGDWVDVASGGGGAFQPVDSSTAVAYTAGNVGIGSFAAAPTYRLEVNLGRNTGETERVRFGNVVFSNGPTLGTSVDAYVSHFNHSSNQGFALRQLSNGDVHINAPIVLDNGGQVQSGRVSLRQNGSQVRLGVTKNGNVVIGSEVEAVEGAYAFQVKGAAYKTEGGDNWNVLSDARVKEDVRDLEAGLEELMRIRPVRFRYNGKGGTRRGEEGVGIIGQEIEQVLPEMVQHVDSGEEFGNEDLRVYNGSALKYVLVNAVKQLAEQVQELKQALAESQNAEENKAD